MNPYMNPYIYLIIILACWFVIMIAYFVISFYIIKKVFGEAI